MVSNMENYNSQILYCLSLFTRQNLKRTDFSFIFLIRQPKLGNVPKVTASSWRSQDLNLGLLTLDSVTIYPFLIWTSCQNVGSQRGWGLFCSAISSHSQQRPGMAGAGGPASSPMAIFSLSWSQVKGAIFFSHAQMSEAIWNPGLRKRD